MLVSDRFVFVHLHKSGGTFVNELMLHSLPGTRRIGYHLPYAEIPESLASLPVLGTVRNPLAYYVSWYHFQSQLPADKRNALYEVCSQNGALDFTATIGNLVSLHERPDLVELLARAFPDQYVTHGLNLTKDCIRRISGSGRGFYSFLYKRMYEGAREPVILRMEELRPALADYLTEQAPEQSRSWRDFLARAPIMNASRHGNPDDYYTAALRDQIRKLDAEIFAEHRY